jgi:hypothetical protein
LAKGAKCPGTSPRLTRLHFIRTRKSQVGQSLSSLPAAKRAKLYREFAADAIQRSQAATDETLRADHLSMAAGWRALAVEVEHAADRFDHLDSVPESLDDRPRLRR